MENYENEELRKDPQYTQPRPEEEPRQPHESQPYSGAGAGRKESPFADSPYVSFYDRQEPASAPLRNDSIPPMPPRESYSDPMAKTKKGRSGSGRALLAAALALILVAGSCGITAALVNQRWERQTAQMTEQFNERLDTVQQQLDGTSGAIVRPEYVIENTDISTIPGAVYAQNVQSVVLVSCQVTSTMYGQTTTGISTGSGFILTEEGYIVTNHHVIEGAAKVTVTTYDGTEYSAEVIGSDATNDVAVLKAQTDKAMPAVKIGSSNALAVGDQVVAIGNPLGELTSTLTVGYVSAKERDVTTERTTINMIQTDAAINSGNSGGPLFNMNGEVVGITTAKYSGASTSGATIEGIGFAIPIDDVIGLVDDLMNYGYITGAYLGVMVSDMDAQTAEYFGLPVGAYVQEATPGYAAEKAGLQAKDIIIALGDYEVGNVTDLTRALRNFKAGDVTQIVVIRSGQEVTLEITLDEKPQETEAAAPEQPDADEMPEDGSYDEWYNYFAPFFGGKD